MHKRSAPHNQKQDERSLVDILGCEAHAMNTLINPYQEYHFFGSIVTFRSSELAKRRSGRREVKGPENEDTEHML